MFRNVLNLHWSINVQRILQTLMCQLTIGGASIVRWTKKMLWYPKTIFYLVKCLKVVDLYCCVHGSNVEYQNENL